VTPDRVAHHRPPPRDGDDDIVLAIDLGTGGPKVAMVSLAGEVIDHEHRRVAMRTLPGGGAVEDPVEWWDAVVGAAGALAERAAVPPGRIVAVACTGQWGSTVPVDGGGEPVGDCLLWLDQRGAHLAARQLGGTVAVDGFRPRLALEFVRRSGGAPSTGGNDPLGHRLWLRHEEPDRWRHTAVLLEPVDYLNLRLTGRVAATQASMTLSWLTDNRRLDAVDYDPVLVRLAGVDATRLPPLLPIRSVVGPVLDDVAAEIGVPAGTPVVTGLPDLHSAALGSGAVGDHLGHLVVSTSAWVGAHTPAKRTSLAKQMATVPSALPGRYVLANNHDAGGVSLEWLRDRVVAPDDGLGAGDPTLPDLDDVAAGVAPGSGGVLFAPWLKGERSPVSDGAMRASFVNVGIDTGRPELVRAVLEGVAHQVRWLWEASESVLRTSLGEPRMVGGGARSDVWCQIHADVLGRPVHRVDQPLLANVRGAALFAGLVLGRLEPADLAARAPIGRTFRPHPSATTVLDEAHAAFRSLHRSQRRLYHRLNR
jgi:xylulokinase